MKLSGLSDDSLRKDTAAALTDARNKKLSDLRAEYADRLLAGAWYSLALGSEPLLTGDRRYDDLKAVFSSEDRVIGGPFSMIRLTDGRVESLAALAVLFTLSRDFTDLKAWKVACNGGKAEILFVEHDDKFCFNDMNRDFYNRGMTGKCQAPALFSEKLGHLYWLSMRSGSNQVWRYDLRNGSCKQMTDGKFQVCQLIDLDTKGRKLYLTIAGKEGNTNPDHRYFYELELATGGILRSFMTIPCDMYFTMDRKLRRVLEASLLICRIPDEKIQEALEFVSWFDWPTIARNTIQSTWDYLEKQL